MRIPGITKLFNFFLKTVYRFDHIGKGVTIHQTCDIRSRAANFIHLCDNVSISKQVWLNIPYEAENMEKPIIIIGERSGLGRRSTISGAQSIKLGKEVMLAPNVFITDHLHEFRDNSKPIKTQGINEPGKVVIEDGCWLGHGCAVIASRGNEVRIGKNSIVGANCLVTKSFPEYSTLIGNPARNVGKVIKR